MSFSKAKIQRFNEIGSKSPCVNSETCCVHRFGYLTLFGALICSSICLRAMTKPGMGSVGFAIFNRHDTCEALAGKFSTTSHDLKQRAISTTIISRYLEINSHSNVPIL